MFSALRPRGLRRNSRVASLAMFGRRLALAAVEHVLRSCSSVSPTLNSRASPTHQLLGQRVPLVKQPAPLLVRLVTLGPQLVQLGLELLPPRLDALVLGVVEHLAQLVNLGAVGGDAVLERARRGKRPLRTAERGDLGQRLFLVDQLELARLDLLVQGAAEQRERRSELDRARRGMTAGSRDALVNLLDVLVRHLGALSLHILDLLLHAFLEPLDLVEGLGPLALLFPAPSAPAPPFASTRHTLACPCAPCSASISARICERLSFSLPAGECKRASFSRTSFYRAVHQLRATPAAPDSLACATHQLALDSLDFLVQLILLLVVRRLVWLGAARALVVGRPGLAVCDLGHGRLFSLVLGRPGGGFKGRGWRRHDEERRVTLCEREGGAKMVY